MTDGVYSFILFSFYSVLSKISLQFIYSLPYTMQLEFRMSLPKSSIVYQFHYSSPRSQNCLFLLEWVQTMITEIWWIFCEHSVIGSLPMVSRLWKFHSLSMPRHPSNAFFFMQYFVRILLGFQIQQNTPRSLGIITNKEGFLRLF